MARTLDVFEAMERRRDRFRRGLVRGSSETRAPHTWTPRMTNESVEGGEGTATELGMSDKQRAARKTKRMKHQGKEQ